MNRPRLVTVKILQLALQPVSGKSAPALVIPKIGRNIVRHLAAENSHLDPPLYLGQILGNRGLCFLMVVLESAVVLLGED